MRAERLERDDAELLRVLDRSWKAARSLAGGRLACRPGCSECCIGPFPITWLDAWRLERGLASLARSDPPRAEAIVSRARSDVAVMTAGFPGDPTSGALADDDAAVERFLSAHAARPCPALDPVSGLCELYEHRPVSCRTIGPPTRIATEVLPPCDLCFPGAEAHEIETCRVAPDPEGLEDRIVGDGTETIVSFALRAGPRTIRNRCRTGPAAC